MHEIQKILLKRLYDRNNQRYGALTKGYDFEDNVVFHLRQLIAKGLIKKTDSVYTVTAKGVKAIVEYDLPDLAYTGSKKLRVGFLCRYHDT